MPLLAAHQSGVAQSMNSPAEIKTAADEARPISVRPALYIAIVLCAFVGTFVYKMRFDGVFACPAADTADSFLAECNSNGYGDYDHGAFWFDLEPATLRAAHDAEVLFVGSSRMAFGLSSPATIGWFADPPTTFYLLGFTRTENVAFVAPLLEKIRPQAKVYVINVDRFFAESETAPVTELLHDRDSRTHYAEKQFWQQMQEPLCRKFPALCGTQIAFFRRIDTGVWHLKGSAPFKSSDVGDGPATNVDRWEQFAAVAQHFVAQLPVDRQCVILTIVPYDGTKRAEAQSIATALGMNLLEPEVDGLKTFDGSHLDPASAERWSAAFFTLAGPQIRSCLAEYQAKSLVESGT
jgi:hypothetical protein